MTRQLSYERLLEVSKHFVCASTGRPSKPKGWYGRDCPCPHCKDQLEVINIAKEILGDCDDAA